MRKLIDLSGKKFGMLTALAYQRQNNKTFWTCKCDCGSVTTVRSSNLISLSTRSCGCYRSGSPREKRISHTIIDGVPVIELFISSKVHGANTVLIDRKDYHLISDYRWSLIKRERTFYATARINGVPVLMHRLILDATESNLDVDHRDGNGLNNTRANLRLATRSQNASNRRLSNKHGVYKGANWNKVIKRWVVKVCKDRKVHYGGCFINEHDAAIAYNELAKKLHGEFALVNDIK